MNTDITFIIADNQDITRMGMHGYISAIFSGCRMIDVTDKKELMLALVECNDSVVILDYTLFDINGIEEFLIIEKRFPRVRWILFSNELSEDFIRARERAMDIIGYNYLKTMQNLHSENCLLAQHLSAKNLLANSADENSSSSKTRSAPASAASRKFDCCVNWFMGIAA